MKMTFCLSGEIYNNLRRLDNRAVRNRCILDDHDNTVANDEAKILAITFLHVILVDHPDVPADTRVFIDDGSSNGRVGSNPQRHLSTLHRL